MRAGLLPFLMKRQIQVKRRIHLKRQSHYEMSEGCGMPLPASVEEGYGRVWNLRISHGGCAGNDPYVRQDRKDFVCECGGTEQAGV